MNVVELKDVKKYYMLGQTRVDALRGVSLAIGQGEFLAIAGPSGSGKSTMLNMFGCIDLPSEGTVRIDGTETEKMTDKELTRYRRTKISFIFQSFNLIPVLNVYENIEFPLLLQRSISRNERSERVMKAIEEVGLLDRVKNKSMELSGGQRQRVAIARALVTKPLIVLADEPTANLDSETGKRIIELMRHINETEKTTFVFSTHDAHIMKEARRVVRILDGRIVAGDANGEG
ncbi:MAG: lipoprotein-releasing system ATP-binding protein LolD [Spirochaetae bacterium HGW-Spirochaetae-7]|jgi:putative ABC transport system ATP-binding protein|nr:MAG: lipoprotein-releasing system ATP-binding protein LolD [Spirochaetae bacterium HGW-Spirochaetae-7]